MEREPGFSPESELPKRPDLSDSIEGLPSPEEIREAAVQDALHPDGIEKFTVNELRVQLTNLPERVKGNPGYSALDRLQALWEKEIDHLPDGAEKEELMTLYDNKASELFAKEIINLPEKDEAENPHYQPAARLTAIGMRIREFPFARAEVMDKVYEVLDQKTRDLGLKGLTGPDGTEL